MTGMTEMTEEMESRTLGQLAGVYRLAIILVICVTAHSAGLLFMFWTLSK